MNHTRKDPPLEVDRGDKSLEEIAMELRDTINRLEYEKVQAQKELSRLMLLIDQKNRSMDKYLETK